MSILSAGHGLLDSRRILVVRGLAYEKIPLSLSSFYIGNPNICKHKKIQKKLKKWPMSSQNRANKLQKNPKYKNTKIRIKCVGMGLVGGGGGGGGVAGQGRAGQGRAGQGRAGQGRAGQGNLLYLLCLISNTMPQLEQSSLQPSTVLHHRHLQSTSYNHLLLLHHLISRKGKLKQQQARNPP